MSENERMADDNTPKLPITSLNESLFRDFVNTNMDDMKVFDGESFLVPMDKFKADMRAFVDEIQKTTDNEEKSKI